MNNREAAADLVSQVQDPGQAALVYAVLALADAVESWVPPSEELPDAPEGQTADTWRW